MIIDSHTHLFPDEVRNRREKFTQWDPYFGALYADPRSRISSCDQLIKSMDRAGVEKSIICGFPWKDPALCRAGNDSIIDYRGRYPERLIGFFTISLSKPQEAAYEIERCVAKGLKGLGEMKFEGAGSHPQELIRMTRPVAEAAHRLNIPLLLHVTEAVGHKYQGKTYTNLHWLWEFIKGNPELDIILAHWGGGFLFYELMPEVKAASRRVFYDTAASPYLYASRIYKVALQIIGAEKILFGSDYPLIPPERYLKEMGEEGIGPSAEERIWGSNIIQLLKI